MIERASTSPNDKVLAELSQIDIADDVAVSRVLGIPDHIERQGLHANRVRISDVEGNHDVGEEGRYLGTPYATIDHVISTLKLKPGETFYDLGSGFGRVPIWGALKSPGAKFVGIELSEQRTKEAKGVVKHLGLQNVELLAGDVRNYDWSTADVFYMYKPFTAGTAHEVMYRLDFLAQQNQGKRKLRLVCFGNINDVVSDVWRLVRDEGELKFYESQ